MDTLRHLAYQEGIVASPMDTISISSSRRLALRTEAEMTCLCAGIGDALGMGRSPAMQAGQVVGRELPGGPTDGISNVSFSTTSNSLLVSSLDSVSSSSRDPLEKYDW